jgi:hypothetical protein
MHAISFLSRWLGDFTVVGHRARAMARLKAVQSLILCVKLSADAPGVGIAAAPLTSNTTSSRSIGCWARFTFTLSEMASIAPSQRRCSATTAVPWSSLTGQTSSPGTSGQCSRPRSPSAVAW